MKTYLSVALLITLLSACKKDETHKKVDINPPLESAGRFTVDSIAGSYAGTFTSINSGHNPGTWPYPDTTFTDTFQVIRLGADSFELTGFNYVPYEGFWHGNLLKNGFDSTSNHYVFDNHIYSAHDSLTLQFSSHATSVNVYLCAGFRWSTTVVGLTSHLSYHFTGNKLP